MPRPPSTPRSYDQYNRPVHRRRPDPLEDSDRQLQESALFKATYDPDGTKFALAQTDLKAFNAWADPVFAEAKASGRFKAWFYMLDR